MTAGEANALFLEEAQELMVKGEAALLALESDPSHRDHLDEIFRALHTIKGSGAMFGHSVLAEFTHAVENLFDDARSGRLQVDRAIVEIGLRSIDGISRILGNPALDSEHLELLNWIEAKRRKENPAVVASNPTSSLQQSPQRSSLPQAWRIRIEPTPEILSRGVRIESLFRDLSELGEIHVQAFTDRIPKITELAPSNLYLYWEISLLTTAPLPKIQEVFLFVEDYLSLEITPLQSELGETAVPKLGEILVDKGHLQPDQVESIRRAQKAFGELAVTEGHVGNEEISAALGEQRIIRSAVLEREARQESSTIRVRKEKLDDLVDLVGELVILQSILEAETQRETPGSLEVIAESFGRIISSLRESAMGVRMVPLTETFSPLQRLVRDLASQLGKEIRLDLQGGSIELDKTIVEAIKDPLVHIVRNSADHGIESPEVRVERGKPSQGVIVVLAAQVGSRVEITVRDDGGGLDVGRIKAKAVEKGLLDASELNEERIISMIFEPGFSTAAKTTDLSGRGVGMDVVKRNVERLRGEVSIRSTLGSGSEIRISIPLTLVIVDGLLVRVGESSYLLPLSDVEECVDWSSDAQASVSQTPVIELRGQLIPVVSLRERLGLPPQNLAKSHLVIVRTEGSRAAFEVDEILKKIQVVIKPLPASMKSLKVLSGATILGDGTVALILDVPAILEQMHTMTSGSKES